MDSLPNNIKYIAVYIKVYKIMLRATIPRGHVSVSEQMKKRN